MNSTDGGNPDASYYTLSPICGGGNDFNGRLGLHIAAIFIILGTSTFGMILPAPFIHIYLLQTG
jgi:hypothetical protein